MVAMSVVCLRRIASGGVLLMAAACALPTGRSAVPAAATVAALEEEYRVRPHGFASPSLLAGAYLFQGRAADARTILERARERTPDDANLLLLAGLAQEALGRPDSARVAYRRYLEMSPEGAYAPEARARMERLDRAALRSYAEELVAARDTSRAPDPRLAVVLPFGVDTSDARLPALATAMTEQLCADLAVTKWIQVADRAAVAAISRAVPPPPVGRDSFTVAESVGRILGAGMVIHGRLGVADGDSLTLEATLLLVEASRVEALPFRDTVSLEAVAAAELGLAEFIHAQVGLQQPFQTWTRSPRGSSDAVVAWMSFGRGIIAFDAGHYAEADGLFTEAYGMDAGFGRAREHARRARYFLASAESPGEVAWLAAQVGVQHELVRALRGAPGSAYEGLSQRLARRERATLAELLGLDPAGGGAVLELLLGPGNGGGP
jgi:tetratricopeptide (TPR) repeat protein